MSTRRKRHALRFSLASNVDRAIEHQRQESLRFGRVLQSWKRGETPVCGRRVPGLFWLEGHAGLYEVALGGIAALHLAGRELVYLQRVDDEVAADQVFAYEESSQIPF